MKRWTGHDADIGAGEWVTRMTEREDNATIAVGGLAAKVGAIERNERSPELMALGKLIELRRREKGLTVEALLRLARVTEAALVDLERGLRMPNTRDVISLLATAIDLPCERLLAVAGLHGTPSPKRNSAALRFASRARPVEGLSPAEQAALGEFLKVLAVD